MREMDSRNVEDICPVLNNHKYEKKKKKEKKRGRTTSNSSDHPFQSPAPPRSDLVIFLAAKKASAGSQSRPVG